MKHIAVVVVCIAVTAALGCSRGEDNYIQGQVDLTGATPEEVEKTITAPIWGASTS